MKTGIFIRAKIQHEWEVIDIGDPRLSDERVLEWLRSRGGYNPWAENVALWLLGRQQIAHETKPEKENTEPAVRKAVFDGHMSESDEDRSMRSKTAKDVLSSVEYIVRHLDSQFGFINRLLDSPDYCMLKAKYDIPKESKMLLSEDVIQDIYDRNYGSGGFDHVEFGKIVAEDQLRHIRDNIEKLPTVRIGSGHYSVPRTAAQDQKDAILNMLEGN